MENGFALQVFQMQVDRTVRELEGCNELTEKFGLSLSEDQRKRLAKHRFLALKNTDRMEFGQGVLKKIITAFCDSPYLTQANYEDTLAELQDMFYYFKNESMEQLSDDELIEAMKSVFDDKAQGSLDYLSGTSLERL